jgi:hypothetical protein
MAEPKLCRYGEWLWRRVNKNRNFSMRRYAHYWLHIYWCPVCNYRMWKADEELMRDDQDTSD